MDDWTVTIDHVFTEPVTVGWYIGLRICPTFTPSPSDLHERVWAFAAEIRAGMPQESIDQLRPNARKMRELHPEARVDELVITFPARDGNGVANGYPPEDLCLTWDEFERRLALHAVRGSTTENAKTEE